MQCVKKLDNTIHIHNYIYMYAYICVRVRVCAPVCVCVQSCAYAYECVCIVRVGALVRVQMNACVCEYVTRLYIMQTNRNILYACVQIYGVIT